MCVRVCVSAVLTLYITIPGTRIGVEMHTYKASRDNNAVTLRESNSLMCRARIICVMSPVYTHPQGNGAYLFKSVEEEQDRASM